MSEAAAAAAVALAAVAVAVAAEGTEVELVAEAAVVPGSTLIPSSSSFGLLLCGMLFGRTLRDWAAFS